MAIISCPECLKEISDKATSCPHCGFPLIDSSNGEVESINTEENNIVQEPENIENIEGKKKIKKTKKIVLILSAILLVAVLVMGTIFTINSFKMNTLEKSIYDALVISAQDDMKNPSAMKILQIGTVIKNENGKMESCIIKLQSTTALGAINTEEIILSSNGYFMTTKELTSGWLSGLTSGVKDRYNINDNNENISVKKINAALNKHWKEIGIE